MLRDGIIFEPSSFTIIKECKYDDKRVEDLYFKVDGKDLCPAAYIFPLERKAEVEVLLAELRKAKKEYDDKVAHVFYKVFPTLR
jgi:hypothetical protein